MRIALIAFSQNGASVVKKIIDGLNHKEDEAKGYIITRHAKGNEQLEPFDSVYELTSKLFFEQDALIFAGACAIAVRAVAPLVESKLKDPAVVVIDEAARFAVSLLSGHAGGANLLAQKVANITKAVPVITTASDVHSALCGKEMHKNLVLGIGCRRGISAEVIERAAVIMMWDQKIPFSRICEVASIDIKRDEEGLLKFARAHSLPISFFSAKELSSLKGEFTPSEKVLRAAGVDNVCERAAAFCGKRGKLIMRKTAKDGVTAAVFEKE